MKRLVELAAADPRLLVSNASIVRFVPWLVLTLIVVIGSDDRESSASSRHCSPLRRTRRRHPQLNNPLIFRAIRGQDYDGW